MTNAPLTQLALTFSILSLGAVGGANATLPELHRRMVDVSRYMDDATFASLVALAQTAPAIMPACIRLRLESSHLERPLMRIWNSTFWTQRR